MKRRHFFGSLFAAGLVLLTSCESDMREGIIQNKVFVPSHSFACTRTMIVGKTVLVLPATCFTSNHWQFNVAGRTVNSDTATRWIDVDENIYSKYNTGDSIIFVNQ